MTLERLRGLLSPEMIAFLAVGGVGYIVDVLVFNIFLLNPHLGSMHPSQARVVAVIVAMVVTYAGNRWWTWRHVERGDRRREVLLFIVANIIGLGISVVTLTISHDIMGLTSRLSDNISANVVGLALGTAFRYWAYSRYVFVSAKEPALLRS